MTTRRRRPDAPSLLLPDSLKPPKASAETNTAYAAAIKGTRAAIEAVRDARAKAREAQHRDAAPSELRKLESAVEEAEHRYREAKRAEERAQNALARAIHDDRDALVEQVPFEQRAEKALAALDAAATELDLLAEEAGTVQTVMTIDQERTRNRGFEPVHLPADRYTSPQAHLAALRGQIIELREAARELTLKVEAPTPSERRRVVA